MKKGYSLLISAVVATSSALSCWGAPVLQTVETGGAYAPALPYVKGESAFVLPRLSKDAVQINGLRRPVSEAAVKRARAAKSATAAQRAIAQDVTIRGWVIWPSDMLGLYNLPHTDGGLLEPFGNSHTGVINGGGYDDGLGTYHGVYYTTTSSGIGDVQIYHLDSETFTITGVDNLTSENALNMVANDIAMDPTTGDVYGCYYGSTGTCWGRGNYLTGVRTEIRALSTDETLVAVGCDTEGQFYGMTRNGVFVKIDKLTGEFTTIAQTDVPCDGYLYGYAGGGCVDMTNNKFYVVYSTYSSGEAGVYEIDLATGQSAPAVDFQRDVMVVGPFISAGNKADKTPMAPALDVVASEGSMTVSYTITLPETLGDGTPVSGTLDWQLLVDGQEVKSGFDQAGAVVTGTLELTKSGDTEFSAIVSNAAGISPRTAVSIYVGTGLPSAPSDVAASWADGKMTITWNAVTASADGGYLDPSAVTYTVKNGEQVLVSDLTAVSYEFQLPVPDVRTSYVYTVSASYNGKTSAEVASNMVWVGAYPTPFETDFTQMSSTASLEDYGYTVVDANGDTRTWSIYVMNMGARYYYHSSNNADDWMISPDIKMEAGKVYPVTIVAASYNTRDDERVEVKGGMGVTADAMTLDVIPATTVLTTDGITLSGILNPTVSGNYNVGIHAVSDKNKYYLFIRSLKVGEGISAATPAGVSDLTLTPEASGLLEVEGSFTLPLQDVSGNQLTGNVAVRVNRGEEVVANLSGAPGATLTFKDSNVPAKGTYTYTVTTLCDGNNGMVTEASVFVGPYAAATPTGVTAFENEQPGMVTMTWNAVTTDINGNEIAPANVSYMVYSVEKTNDGTTVTPMLDAPVATASATFQGVTNPAVQEFKQYAVSAFNRDAESTGTAVTELIPVGQAYALPVLYSGSDSQSKYIEATSSAGTGFWDIYSDTTLEGGPAPFATDDYYGCYSGAQELYGDLYTGKIDLTAAERPEVSFQTYCLMEGDANFLEVFAIVDGNTERLTAALHSEMAPNQWNKVRIDLSAYKGKRIQLMFRAVAKTHAYTLLDEILVRETPARDMVALWMSAPAQVKPGEKFNISFNMANHGYLDATDVTVNLYRNGELADTRQIASLAAAEEMIVLFENEISYFDEDNTGAIYSAEIIYDGDEDETNNSSLDVAVERPESNLPAITDLSGVTTDQGNHLTWTPYSTDNLPAVEKTEDFETASPFAHEFGDWTFLTLNESAVQYIYGVTFPGIEAYETVCSWFVINNEGAESVFPSHSGASFIASLAKTDRAANDDWAISPRLTGEAQTISFHAIAYNYRYAESFEVYYTTDDSVDPADYVLLEGTSAQTVTSDAWTKFEYQLPAGAMHFAVRAVSADCYILMLDDFVFTPDPLLDAPTLVGYDLYRDGVKLTEQPLTEPEYLDTEAGEGNHTYHVVTRFNEGDSELSNGVTLMTSGLTLVGAVSVKVYADNSEIVVSGAAGENVSVTTVDGRTLYRATGDFRLPVAGGIYLVSVGNATTVKLLVK